MEREAFRLARVSQMDRVSENVLDAVTAHAEGAIDDAALLAAIREQFMEQYGTDFAAADDAWRWFSEKIKPGIEKIKETSDPRRIANWLGTAIVNGARAATSRGGKRMWLSRRDQKVRPFHVEADGQVVGKNEKFTVCDGVEMDFPGQPVGDPSCFLGCRCVLADPAMFQLEVEMTITADDVASFQAEPAVDEMPTDGFIEDDIPAMIPWNGILVPEGIQSGDGRMFSPEALTWRDLPLPLRWQKSDTGGHDGAVIVGTIDDIWRDNNLIRAAGMMLDSPEADECCGQIADGALRGISVDVDQAELASEPTEDGVEFGKGRISAATIVHIPAFMEAIISLGEFQPMVTSDTTLPIEQAPAPAPSSYSEELRNYDAEQRRDMAKRGLALPDGSFPVADCEDLKNAIQAIGRASDPAKAKAHIKKRASALGCDVDLPEGWSVESGDFSQEAFNRGPGWVTNPVETKRIHDFWTKPGHEGYAKIRWGTPGDFTRLRSHLKKYIDPLYLNRTAARWSHDVLGYWPGQCGLPGNPPCGKRRGSSVHADETVNLGHASERGQDALPEGPRVHAGQHLHHPEHREQDLQDVQAGSMGSKAAQDIGAAPVGAGGYQRSGRLLDMAGGEDDASGSLARGPQVRRDLGRSEGSGKDPLRAPGRVGRDQWPYTGRVDDRPSVPGETVRESGTSGADIRVREYSTAMGAPKGMSASADPLPHEWFENPNLEQPTGLTIDGQRIYGHIAEWETCHVGRKLCTTSPHSEHDYAYFRTGAIVTDKGIVPVGNLTMDTGHPDEFAPANSAKSHYDNTSTVVADVACGEDEHGIWVSGALRDITPDQERALLAGAPSGDWRPIGGSLELIAALIVNVPGFPVKRPLVAMAGDEQASLIITSDLRTSQVVPFADTGTDAVVDLVIKRLENMTANKARVETVRREMNTARIKAVEASIRGGQ